ncbi:DUF4268 domain-containing protein [Aquiflexum sp.]|uniref:DUF4268 domain-containing protein n=1 Tax=Aquiflexum sp. TaxID=1872584 RepID=UPI0035945E69
MKANELQIINFLQTPKVQFVIPVYQRNYDWTTTECEELLKDIISVREENRSSHFIGSIVFIHEGIYSTSEVRELIIIDGQQRLTTINILFVALYSFSLENGKKQDADMLYNTFLINQYVQYEISKLKLKQTDANSVAFKAILVGTEKGIDDYSNVIENYNYFRGIITEENFQTILEGLHRLIFVEISLERGKDDPQRIFESLNSTGLDLSQSDLIRNFILMDLPHLGQTKVYEAVWSPIEQNARDITKRTSLVSDYIRDYLTLKNKKIPNKNKVYAEFKGLYQNKKDETYHQELENIKSLSYHYKKFVNPSTVPDKLIRRELEYIHRLEINVAYPFLLQVFEDEENGIINKDELIKVLKLVQSFVWRRFIIGLPTSALNKIFMTLYSEIDSEEYYESLAVALLKKGGSLKFPTNEEIKVALRDKDLYNTQAKNRNYLFELLENFKNKEHVDTSNEQITVEHIFPRTPCPEWEDELRPESYFDFKEKYLNTIGNLTLSGNNGALSNRTFKEKKEMNEAGKEQGYIFSRLWLNTYLQKIDKWDISAFEERLKIIYERFLKIWEYPDVVVFDSRDAEEQNIFDADTPTYKKLEYFIFEDTKIDEEAVAQMYFYVLKQLYQKNSELLLEGQEIIKITRNIKDFRDGREIANGWFVEANIDSNTKFSALKKLLTIYEMEEELFIKYQSGPVNSGEPGKFSIRRKYWQQLIPLLEGTGLFTKIKPTKDHWLSTGAGKSGINFTMIITKSCVRVELGILSSSKETNKRDFKRLYQQKSDIETAFGRPLEWQELPDNKMSRIKTEMTGINLFNEGDWDQMNQFFIENLPRFERAFKEQILRLK